MAELQNSVSALDREIDHREEKVKDIEKILAIKKLEISNREKRDLKEKLDIKDDQLNELRGHLKHNLEILFDLQTELNEIISSPQDLEKIVWRCNLKVNSLQKMLESKDIRINHRDDGLANKVKLKDKTLSEISDKLHQRENVASHKRKISQNIMHQQLENNCRDILLKNEQLSNQRDLAKQTSKKLQIKNYPLLVDEIATLKTKNRILEAEMEQYNMEINHLQKQIECKQTEINDIDKLLTSALDERDKQKCFLQRALIEKDEKEFKLNQTISSLKLEIQSLEENKERRDQKVLQLEETIKSNEKEIIQIREKNILLVKEVKEKNHLNHMLKTQQETESKLVGTIDILQRKNQCLKRAFENSELKVKELEKELESIKAEIGRGRDHLIRNLKEKDKQFSDRMYRQQQFLNQLHDTEKEIKKIVISLTTRTCYMEKEIKDRDLKIEQLNEMLSESRKECETNELSLTEQDSQLCELIDQFQNTSEQMQEAEIVLNGTITSQRKEIHRLETEAEQRIKTISHLGETLSSNAIKMTEMRDSNKHLKNTVNEKDEQLRKQNNQIKWFQEREIQFGTLVTSLEKKTQSLEADIERRDLRIKGHEEKLDSMRTEISDRSDVKVKDLELQLHSMTSERNEGNELLEKEVAEKKKLQQVLKELHENETKLNDIITSLKKQNQEKDNKLSEIGDQLIQTLKTLDDKGAEIKQMDIALKEIKCLEAEVERHEQNYTILEEMLHSKMNEMKELSNRNEILRNTMEKNGKESFHLKYTLKGLQETDTSLGGFTASHKKTNHQGLERHDLLVKHFERRLDIIKTEISVGYERLENMLEEKDRQLSQKRNQFQEAFNQVKEKETEFNETINLLKEKNKEKENQIFDLNDQLQQNLKELDDKKTEVSEIDVSLKKKVKFLESEVEQREQNVTNLKKMLDSTKVDMRKTVERNEFLERAVEGKDNQLHEKTDQLNRASEKMQETCTEFDGIILSLKEKNLGLQTDIDERNQQIHELKEQLDQIKTEKSDRADLLTKEVNQFSEKNYQLQESLKHLRENEKEKDDQISELKDQIENIKKQLNDKEAKIEEFDTALKNKLKYFESEMERCCRNNKHLQQRLSSKEVELTRVTDINKLLRNKVKEKDDQLHEQNDQLKCTLKNLQETDTKLNESIISLKERNQGLQTDIYERDLQIHDLKEQLNKLKTDKSDRTKLLTKEVDQFSEKNYELQEALNQLRENEAKLNAVTSLLQTQNKEKDNQISELTHQIEHITKQLNAREAQIEEFDTSMKTKMKYFETEVESRECKIRHLEEKLSCNEIELTGVTDINKRLRNKVKGKDDQLNEQNDQLNRTSKKLQEKDTELGGIVLSLKEKNESLQTDICERDLQIHDLKEKLNKSRTDKSDRIELLTKEVNQFSEKNYELQEALNQLRENEAKLNAVTSLLQKQNKEKDNQLSDLTDQNEHMMKQLKTKEAQIEEFDTLLKKKLMYFDTEVESRECKIRHLEETLSSKDVELIRMTDINKLLGKKVKETDDQMQKQTDQLRQEIQHLHGEVKRRDIKVNDLEKLLHRKKLENRETEQNKDTREKEKKLADLKDQLQKTLAKLHDTETELDETKTRLSKAMGDRLTDNNRNITDLSDRNRPTKLAERCAELYDNQWTDAFDILEEYFSAEENVIEALLQILQDVMTFCITKAREQVEELGRNLKFSDQPGNGNVSADVHKLLKDCRKAVAPVAIGNLYKMYVSHLKQSSNNTLRTATEVGSYTSECLEICWFMVIQDPPVAFAPLLRKGSGFNTDLYKPYTSSGTHIGYVVWPPLLLHEGGPILAKGVAQGYGKKSEKGT